MRTRMLLRALAVAALPIAASAAEELYINSLKTGVTKLLVYDTAGGESVGFIAARDFQPMLVNDRDGDWLEIVLDDNYYFVKADQVIVNRLRPQRSAALTPRASSGVRLHLRSP